MAFSSNAAKPRSSPRGSGRFKVKRSRAPVSMLDVLGLCVHVTLTNLMAGDFVVASPWFPALLRQPWLSGLTYVGLTLQMAAAGRVNSAANSLIPSGRMGFARKWSKPASIPMTRSAGEALPDTIMVDARCCRGCFLICVQTS